jgi:hypothetical protein
VRIPASPRTGRAHRRAQLPDKPARDRVHNLYASRPLPALLSLTDACAVGAVTAVLVVLTLWHRVRVRRVFAANMARTDATGLPPGWVRGPGLARPAQAHMVGPMPAYMAPVSLRSSLPLPFLRSSRVFVFVSFHRIQPFHFPSRDLLRPSCCPPHPARARSSPFCSSRSFFVVLLTHTVPSRPVRHQSMRTCTRPRRPATSRRASRCLRPRARRLRRGRRRGSRTLYRHRQ